MDHILCVHHCLASFIKYNYFDIHPWCLSIVHFLSMLNIVLLYRYTPFLPVDGQLGSLYFGLLQIKLLQIFMFSLGTVKRMKSHRLGENIC